MGHYNSKAHGLGVVTIVVTDENVPQTSQYTSQMYKTDAGHTVQVAQARAELLVNVIAINNPPSVHVPGEVYGQRSPLDPHNLVVVAVRQVHIDEDHSHPPT